MHFDHLEETVKKGNLHAGLLVLPMAYDLGFDFKSYSESQEKDVFIADFIKKLDGEIDFALITEELDRSVVLMARRYCLTFDDILHMKSLQTDYKSHSVSDATMERLFKSTQVFAVEWAIYQHFESKFQHLVKQEQGFEAEVNQFLQYKKAKLDHCTDGTRVVGNISLIRYLNSQIKFIEVYKMKTQNIRRNNDFFLKASFHSEKFHGYT